MIAGDLCYLGVLAALQATTEVLAESPDGRPIVVWTVLFAARTPMLAGMIWANYLIENADAASTRITGSAAFAGLAVAGVVGLLSVPAQGGVGVLVALAAAEAVQAVQAATVWHRLARRAGRAGPVRALEDEARVASIRRNDQGPALGLPRTGPSPGASS